MSLTEIRLSPKNFTKESLEVLRPCKSLKKIIIGEKGTDTLAAKDFWRMVDAGEFKP
jgi:hypothetical protein